MSGACPEDRIAVAHESDRGDDRVLGRRGLVDLGIRSCLAGAFDESRPDGGGVLEARVVVGDHEDVAAFDSGARHVEAFARISVAIGTEQHQHLARGHSADGGERLLERVGGVTEVTNTAGPVDPETSWVRPGRYARIPPSRVSASTMRSQA